MSLQKEIESVINCHSAENESDTPDFILAAYISDCLAAFNRAVNMRESWYGRKPQKQEPIFMKHRIGYIMEIPENCYQCKVKNLCYRDNARHKDIECLNYHKRVSEEKENCTTIPDNSAKSQQKA